MNTLFAPWRMEFIEKGAGGPCVFCEMMKNPDRDTALQVIARGENVIVAMNKYPYTHGHLLIIPCRHEADWTKLTTAEISELGLLTQRGLRALAKAFSPQGFNLGVNLGKAAGAGIEQHVHQHIVPRWIGDFNFMPLLSETKVISEHLSSTYDKVKKAWEEVA